MATRVTDEPGRSRYELELDGDLAGFAAYALRGTRITISHTEVAPAFRGRGLADALARGALADVRERGLSLIPTCPFLAAYVSRHRAEYADLVLPAVRSRLLGDEPAT